MHSKHLHVGRGGFNCVCCFPPPGSRARKAEFRRAKRREAREALADEFEAMAEEEAARCATCDRWIEEGERGPHCMSCRNYWEDYESMMADEYEREFAGYDSDDPFDY
jgi:hypothetical protein